MKLKRKKGYFSISAVAKMFSVHQQTVRLYEKEGLLTPKRSSGNTRLFSEEDVDRLEEIIYLTHQLGINLAGVEMILKLKKQISKMQKDMNDVFAKTQAELDKETEASKEAVQSSMKQLAQMKKDRRSVPALPQQKLQKRDGEKAADPEDDPWKIEYDDY